MVSGGTFTPPEFCGSCGRKLDTGNNCPVCWPGPDLRQRQQDEIDHYRGKVIPEMQAEMDRLRERLEQAGGGCYKKRAMFLVRAGPDSVSTPSSGESDVKRLIRWLKRTFPPQRRTSDYTVERIRGWVR